MYVIHVCMLPGILLPAYLSATPVLPLKASLLFQAGYFQREALCRQNFAKSLKIVLGRVDCVSYSAVSPQSRFQ